MISAIAVAVESKSAEGPFRARCHSNLTANQWAFFPCLAEEQPCWWRLLSKPFPPSRQTAVLPPNVPNRRATSFSIIHSYLWSSTDHHDWLMKPIRKSLNIQVLWWLLQTSSKKTVEKNQAFSFFFFEEVNFLQKLIWSLGGNFENDSSIKRILKAYYPFIAINGPMD